MIDVAAIKDVIKGILSADQPLKQQIAVIESSYTEPASTSGQVSIINGEMAFENIGVMLPVIVVIRTRVPSRSSSDTRNDLAAKRILELLTDPATKRLNGTVSNLKSYTVENYTDEENTETRTLAVTLLYSIIEA